VFLKKGDAPRDLLRPFPRHHSAQSRAGKYNMIVSISEIVVVHEVDDVVDQAQVHAGDQQDVVLRRIVEQPLLGREMQVGHDGLLGVA
jgi:hypothetical protein